MNRKVEWCLHYWDGDKFWDTGWHKAKSKQAAKISATKALSAAKFGEDSVSSNLLEAVIEVRYEWGDLATKFTKHKNNLYGKWVRVRV